MSLKRLPLIRHIRYWILIYRVNQHYAFYRTPGMPPPHAESDYERARMIWRGEA